jgi:hypothetical protein
VRSQRCIACGQAYILLLDDRCIIDGVQMNIAYSEASSEMIAGCIETGRKVTLILQSYSSP